MTDIPNRSEDGAFVSTGELPDPGVVRTLVDEAYERYRDNREGRTSTYAPLARVPHDLFGVCVADTHGAIYAVGDSEYEFSIMSISKPFVFALVCSLLGPGEVREKIGVNSTGLPFNSLTAVERSHDGRTNPMVNAGAIASTSLVPGDSSEARWTHVRDGLSAFAGRPLTLDEEIYASVSTSNARNHRLEARRQVSLRPPIRAT